jgi:hypothetical protein
MQAHCESRAVVNATSADADVVVLVKRVRDETLRAVRHAKIAWDVVDSYPQPAGNDWTEREAKDWLDRELNRIQPNAVIAATKKMAEDLKPYGLPVLWLRHHHRPGIQRNPIRERVTVVGYEGARQYIEPWRTAVEAQCKRIGASFVINPDRLCDCDIILALRGSNGYPPRNWKSNVKIANAHASGTPFIGGREQGYLEVATGCEYWADTPKELGIAFDWLRDQSARELIHDRFVRAAYSVEQAAADLYAFLRTI